MGVRLVVAMDKWDDAGFLAQDAEAVAKKTRDRGECPCN
jgi:hypothetical protein